MNKEQEYKKQIALNSQHLFYLVFFLIFLVISIACIIANEIGVSILSAILALLLISISLISPLYIIFSEDEVEIVYNFRQREKIKWKDVRDIYQTGSWFYKAGGLPHYVLLYPKKEKRLFFVTGEIPKTRKTKKLIKMYYKKNIGKG